MSDHLNAQSVRVSPFRVFRNRNFALIWTGQLISTMGSALTSIAASILVYRLTDSAMSVGLMLMATAAPSLLVGLFAGVLVDRFNRKTIMMATNLIRTFLVVLIPLLVPQNILWLYLIVMLSSAIGQFFDPAHESVLPEIASEEELAAANSLMAISSFGSTAIGFAASGLIAASANISWAFYLNALSFLISALFIYLLNIKPLSVDDSTSVSLVIKNLQLGMRQLFGTPILRSLFQAQILTLIAFGLSNALLLPFAMRALNATEFEYGIQEALTSVGFVIASLLVAGVFDRMREGAWMAGSFIGMAIANIAYSFTRSIPLAIIIVMISGFFNAPSSIARRLVIQRNTPREMRGRVNSVFFVSRDILFLIGMALAGFADYIDIRLMYLFSAILLLCGGLLVLVLPGLRQNRGEWKQALHLLRSAPQNQGLGVEHKAKLSDLDALKGLIPTFPELSKNERDELLKDAKIIKVEAGTNVLQHGTESDSVYFILSGRAIAGSAEKDGNYRSLSTMNAGDFFGEISALTGTPRTVDVAATENSSFLVISAQKLSDLMNDRVFKALIMEKFFERINRSSINELPRFAGIDSKSAEELRSN